MLVNACNGIVVLCGRIDQMYKAFNIVVVRILGNDSTDMPAQATLTKEFAYVFSIIQRQKFHCRENVLLNKQERKELTQISVIATQNR